MGKVVVMKRIITVFSRAVTYEYEVALMIMMTEMVN